VFVKLHENAIFNKGMINRLLCSWMFPVASLVGFVFFQQFLEIERVEVINFISNIADSAGIGDLVVSEGELLYIIFLAVPMEVGDEDLSVSLAILLQTIPSRVFAQNKLLIDSPEVDVFIFLVSDPFHSPRELLQLCLIIRFAEERV
jgi:hypothetical protein